MINRFTVVGALILLLSVPTFGQTFTGNTGLIADSGITRFAIYVTGLTSGFNSSFGLEQICFNIVHPDVSTLNLILVSPAGREVELASPIDRSGPNFNNTCLRGDLPNIIHYNDPPYTGNYRAEGQLGEVNVNQDDGNGTWILIVEDTRLDGLTGNCTNTSLTFGGNPAILFRLITSNLPIITINTRGQIIPDDPKITARLGIVDNGSGQLNNSAGPFNGYWGEIGIELRGNSSQEFPKKPFSFELRDTAGLDLNRSLLGMPTESDWLLIPNFADKSMLRNAFTYSLSQAMGQYATRYRFVEVVINGRYNGVYQLMERLKRGANRVNISRLRVSDTTGANVTGGYIIKLDKVDSVGTLGFYSSQPGYQRTDKPFYQFEYPKPEDILPQQSRYIQAFMDTMETTMMGPNFDNVTTGYAKYIDVKSFIDFQIMQELGRNVDGYRYSTYLHKLKITSGNKLRMGPIWDFDIAYGNLNYSSGPIATGWRYQDNSGPVFPAWWERLATDTNYVRQRRCRWITLRQNLLDTFRVSRFIDSSAQLMGPAVDRNYNWWTTLGSYVWPNPRPIPVTYQGEINNLKNWLKDRIVWLDSAFGTTCDQNFVSLADNNAQGQWQLWPNPATEAINISPPFGQIIKHIRLLGTDGRLISTYTEADIKPEGATTLDISQLPTGLYLIQITRQDGQQVLKRIIKQ